jgi:hypothetical protein
MAGSRSGSGKATNKKQVNRVSKTIWETLKCINIIEEYEDQKPMETNVFYTPPNSPSKLMNENEPSWPIGIDR